jgi:hypothetical protein
MITSWVFVRTYDPSLPQRVVGAVVGGVNLKSDASKVLGDVNIYVAILKRITTSLHNAQDIPATRNGHLYGDFITIRPVGIVKRDGDVSA